MKIVGLTGGIGSGKSTVSRIFLSCPDPPVVIDLDLIARQVVARGTRAYRQILDQFGRDEGVALVEPETGELDRKRLGAIIFADPAKRKSLNAITHWPICFTLLQLLLHHLLV